MVTNTANRPSHERVKQAISSQTNKPNHEYSHELELLPSGTVAQHLGFQDIWMNPLACWHTSSHLAGWYNNRPMAGTH